MDIAVPMDGHQDLTELRSKLGRSKNPGADIRNALELLSKVCSIHLLHGEPEKSLVFACFIHLCNSRDSELTKRLEFPHESLSRFWLIEVLEL